MKQMEYGVRTEVDLPFQCALTRTREALQQQGFGVLAETDVRARLNEKLGVDGPRSVIFEACNPEVGLLLPCDVIVYEDVCGGVTVAALDPGAMLSAAGADAEAAAVRKSARARLAAVMDTLRPCASR